MSEESVEPILVRYEAVDTLLCNVRQVSENKPSVGELGFEIRADIKSVERTTGMMPIILDIVLTEPNLTEPIARLVV